MEAISATICTEDIELHKNQAEKKVEEANTIRKRRNSTSPSSTDETVTKKIKTDCDKPEIEKKNEEENIPQPVKTSPLLTDKQVTKKIKTDCDELEKEEKNDEENIPQPVKTSPLLTDEQVTRKIKTDCDKPENEKENDEKTITQPALKRREEAVKFPKLYRLLHEREDTCITNGLFAKSPGAEKDVATHVTTGSQRGHSSQYISTCSSLCNAESFRSLKLNSGYKWGMKHIVEIDVGSLPDDVEIIDLRTKILRRKYEVTDKEINERFHKFADDHKEVLLVGTVPASCLKLREFTGVVPDSDTSCSDPDDILSDNLEFNGYDFNSSNSDSDC